MFLFYQKIFILQALTLPIMLLFIGIILFSNISLDRGLGNGLKYDTWFNDMIESY